jgi:hypothetical protein
MRSACRRWVWHILEKASLFCSFFMSNSSQARRPARPLRKQQQSSANSSMSQTTRPTLSRKPSVRAICLLDHVNLTKTEAYRKDDPEAAARCLDKAITHYCSKGNFRRAATHKQNLAELYEVELGDNSRAAAAYEEAAGWYESVSLLS